jgi:hypothetical protein
MKVKMMMVMEVMTTSDTSSCTRIIPKNYTESANLMGQKKTTETPA